ncbi:MAG: putative glycolipid-binding domain-containing protein [Burkholderiales bacterium]
MTLDLTRIWRRIGLKGLEHLTLKQVEGGYRADSVLSVEVDLGGVTCEYHFDLDEGWRTKTFTLTQSQAGEDHSLLIDRAGGSEWKVNGAIRPDLNGCLDLDLTVSPFTNTLAIRQLNLAPNEAKEIAAVYVDIPSLEVTLARQRYQRLDANDPPLRFLYSGLDSGFIEEITVDEHGLVERYPRFAERIA